MYELFENLSLIWFLAQSGLVGLLYSFFKLLVRQLLVRGPLPEWIVVIKFRVKRVLLIRGFILYTHAFM